MVYKSDEQIVIQAPSAMKDALGEYSQEHDIPMSEIVRQAIAQFIGFEYERAPRTRTHKYDSPEAQRAAQYERAALKRWAQTEGARRLNAGEIELATMIARATMSNDYEALQMLREEIERDAEA